jgi:predicted DsbA family dithiol-disulfide isomerase
VGQDQQVLDELRKIRQLLQLIEQMIAQQNIPRQMPAPWEMRHTILVNHAHLANDAFTKFAQDLQLDVTAFSTCIADSTRFRAEIQKDLADGTAAGVDGTPSFVIGRSSASGLVDGVRVAGAQPYSVFEAKFKELLNPKPGTTP